MTYIPSPPPRRDRGRGRGRGERFASARSRIAYAASADVHGERIAFHEAELGVDVDGEGIDPGVVGVSLGIDAKRVNWLTAALFLQRGLIGGYHRLGLFEPQLAMR